MHLLFIHQGFPGQYIHIVRELAKNNRHTITALGLNSRHRDIPISVNYIKYEIEKGNLQGLHPWLTDIETKVIRGEACGRKAHELKNKGYEPDIICGHPGWGELLFLKEIWPKCPILNYQEFFYKAEGLDTGFDKEFGGHDQWTDKARSRMKGANCLLNLDIADWNVTPTHFQKSSFPEKWHDKISVLHDGINTTEAKPAKKKKVINIDNNTKIELDENMITFINRRIEPYRGCHTFIRAIPEIQAKVQNSQIVIIGAETGVSYGAKCTDGEWKDIFLKEIEGQYDKSRVHFVGTISYNAFITLMQRTDAHVYLTYPFVLSWSLLEAMSCEAPVIGSETLPVMEVIKNGENGILTDFFSSSMLAENISLLCKDKKLAKKLGKEARKTIVEKYELGMCVEDQISLIKLVAKGAVS